MTLDGPHEKRTVSIPNLENEQLRVLANYILHITIVKDILHWIYLF